MSSPGALSSEPVTDGSQRVTFLASLALGSMIYHRHRKTSRNTIYRPIPDIYRRRTLTEKGCTRPHFPGPELVHPAYRGSIYKRPKSRDGDPPTLTEAMDHAGPYYDVEGTAVTGDRDEHI